MRFTLLGFCEFFVKSFGLGEVMGADCLCVGSGVLRSSFTGGELNHLLNNFIRVVPSMDSLKYLYVLNWVTLNVLVAVGAQA
jgi:hypothetical protein